MKSLSLIFAALIGFLSAQDSPLPVADLQRNTPVSFTKEIVPFLKKNCFACHNEKKAKADLNLESPQAMITGGDSGPSLVPGKPMESLVFTYSAHLEDDPMPPAKNKSKAKNLTPEELALLQLWIEQGGIGESAAVLPGPEKWNDLSADRTIYASAISPDGRFVAAGRGNRLYLYDLHRGALEGELVDPGLGNNAAHRDTIHSLAFNRDGVLASGGFRSVKIWTRTSDLPLPLAKPLPDSTGLLGVSPNAQWLGTSDRQGNLTLHSLGGIPAPKLSKKHKASVHALAFTEDHSTLYSLDEDQTLRRTILANPGEPKEVTGLPNSTSLAPLDQGKLIALGGIDGIIRLLPATAFDQTNPAPPVELKGHGAKVTALVSTNPEGSQLLSASDDGSLRFWDLSGKQLRQVNHGSPVVALAIHHETNCFASAGTDGIVRIWNATTGAKSGDLKGDHLLATRQIAAKQNLEVAKRVHDLRSNELQAIEKEWQRLLELSKARAEAFSAALKEFAAKDTQLRQVRRASEQFHNSVIQLEKAEQPSLLGQARERARKADEAFKKVQGEWTAALRKKRAAKNNRDLVIRDGTRAGEQLFSARTASLEAANQLTSAEEEMKATEEEMKAVDPGVIGNLSFSPDGKTLGAATEKLGIQLWSLENRKPLDMLQRGRPALRVCFDKKGQVIARFSDHALVRFPKATWSLRRRIGDGSGAELFPGRVLALDFHPRGSLLATGSGIPSRSGVLRIWDIHSGNLASEIPDSHKDTITGIVFSPDGEAVATASTDRLIKIHDLESGTLLQKLEGHTHHVLDVDWSADGQTIASAGADNLIKQWNVKTGKQTKSEGGSRKEFTAVGFLGAGNTLLTASGETSVKIANQNLGGASGFVYTATASPDGQIIVAGGEDGILRVWRAKDRKLLLSFPPP
jgi:WD40 repeat protein